MTKSDSGLRFGFGTNWSLFLSVLNETRIQAAEKSLQTMLGEETLQGKRFLDAGCGSGIFSLAAHRLGARVHSFDYDPAAAACAEEVRKRFQRSVSTWTIERGSVLDTEYLKSLGAFDIVYSWGVLHHTGALHQALENIQIPVAPGGKLFISIYNDQGGSSRRWTAIKRLYNRSPKPVQLLLVAGVGAYFESMGLLARLSRLENPLPFKRWKAHREERGMSTWYDLVDWTGGYPFEVAKPEDIFELFRRRGFQLLRLKTVGGGHGCNEFVFERPSRNIPG